jgi:hypothetical protein
MPKYLGDVRCWVNSGKHLLALRFSGFDPKETFALLFLAEYYVEPDQAEVRQALCQWGIQHSEAIDRGKLILCRRTANAEAHTPDWRP